MARENKNPKGYRRRIFSIGLLLLLLISGSLFFASRINGSDIGVKNNHQPSATAGSTATSTATATPTTATITPTPTPTPLFVDNFVDNQKGWFSNNSIGYTRLIGNDQLLLSDSTHTPLIETLPTGTNFGDFTLTTSFTFLKGDEHDSVGFYLRSDTYLNHDYRINIYGNTTYAIYKDSLINNNDQTNNNSDQVSTILAGPTQNAALLPVGQPNTLTITMNGADLSLTINGKAAATVIDSDYQHGQIVLFVDNGYTSDAVSAVFSSIDVEPLPTPIANQVTPTPGP